MWPWASNETSLSLCKIMSRFSQGSHGMMFKLRDVPHCRLVSVCPKFAREQFPSLGTRLQNLLSSCGTLSPSVILSPPPDPRRGTGTSGSFLPLSPVCPFHSIPACCILRPFGGFLLIVSPCERKNDLSSTPATTHALLGPSEEPAEREHKAEPWPKAPYAAV